MTFQALKSRWTAFRFRPADIKIISGSAMGLGMRLVSILLGIIQVPILVNYLGSEGYGLFLVLGQFAAWIALTDPGIANSLINLLAKSQAESDKELASRAFSTAFFFLLSLALLLWLVISAGAWNLPVGEFFKTSDPSLRIQLPVLAFMALALPVLSIVGSILPTSFLAFQEHGTSALTHIAGMLFSFGLVLLVTHLDLGIIAVLLTTGLAPSIVAVALAVIQFTKRPHLIPRFSNVSVPLGFSMLSIGVRIMLLQVCWLMLSGIGQFVVSVHMGVEANAVYGTAVKVSSYLSTFPLLLYSYLWPAYAEAAARGDYHWIRKRFLASTGAVLVLSFVAYGTLAVIGRQLVLWWTGGKIDIPAQIWLLLIPWGLLVCLISQTNCLCNATGRLNGLLVAAGIAALVNLALANLWVHPHGIPGVIAAAVAAGCLQVVLSVFPVSSVFRTPHKSPA